MRKFLLSILCSFSLLISVPTSMDVNAEESHVIPIAMATDNNYVLPTIVAITSMLENADKNTVYNYNLLVSGDFTEENTQKFLTLKKKYSNNCEFKFINMGNAYAGNKEVGTRITTPMYYRLSLPSILKEDKCIYLDGDTIVEKDLSELYNVNLDNYYLAGVKAAGIQIAGERYAKLLKIPDMKQYINSGVLLINLKKMREDKLEDKFSEFIENTINKEEKLNCPDQDTINAVCYNNIKILPLKYNTMTVYNLTNPNTYIKSKKFQNCYSQTEWNEAASSPAILHYACKLKPWNDEESNMAEYWWKYARKTKFFNEIRRQFWYDYFSSLPEDKYPEALKKWYKEKMKSELNLEHPKTYTEKVQWLKLNDMDELKTKLADKYLVRDYVKDKIGEKYLVKLLGVWDNFDEIDFDKLPDKFVLKANHGCAFNIIVRDKKNFDKEDARKKFNKWLKTNFAYCSGLELQYKNIKPKIIAEEYLENDGSDLYDYKVWCFDGKPYYTMFLSERNKSLKMSFYDNDWKLQPFVYSHKKNDKAIERPDNFNELLEAAKKLSKGFKHVRVDFYRLNDGTLKFGELTFSSASGYMSWRPIKYNRFFGDLIKLPTDEQ